MNDALPIAAARSDDEMVEACRAVVAKSPHVLYHPHKLERAIPAVAGAKPISWDWYLRSATQPIGITVLDLAFNAALNGGYFQYDPNGRIVQWAKDGSGSAMLLDWIAALHREGLEPGSDVPLDERFERVATMLEGVPCAEERLEIVVEFADPTRLAVLTRIADRVTSGRPVVFDLPLVDEVAAAFPASFGADPFRKKACLLFLMLAGHLQSRGQAASYRLPIPSDYQIPRILAWLGVIEVSDAFAAALKDETRLLDVESAMVTHFRAAAVVCARDLGRATRQEDHLIDGALFMGFRKNAEFQRDSLPPMRCASLWF